MRDNDTIYQIETSELNQEMMQFLVVNRRPVKTDANEQDNIQQELYKIFRKYA